MEEKSEEPQKLPLRYYKTRSFKVKNIALNELKESLNIDLQQQQKQIVVDKNSSHNDKQADNKNNNNKQVIKCKKIRKHRKGDQQFLLKMNQKTNIWRLRQILPKQTLVDLNVDSQVYNTKKSPSNDYMIIGDQIEEEMNGHQQQIEALKKQLEQKNEESFEFLNKQILFWCNQKKSG